MAAGNEGVAPQLRVPPARMTRVAQLEEAGRAARRTDDFDSARARFEMALALLGDEHPVWRARLLTQLSRVLMLSGDPKASLDAARTAVEVAPTGPSSAVALARLAVSLCRLGRADEGLGIAGQAMDVAGRTSDAVAQGAARNALGYALRFTGQPRKAAEAFRAAVPLAKTAGDDEAVVARLIDFAGCLELAGEVQQAADVAHGALLEAQRREVSRGMAAAAYADLLFRVGRWQPAIHVVDDALAEGATIPWLLLVRAHLHMARGELARARRVLALAERPADGPRAGGWDGPHETAAEIFLWSARPDRALERVQQAVTTVQERSDAIRRLVPLGLRAAADLRARPSDAAAGGGWREVADSLIDRLRRHAALMRDGHPDESGPDLAAAEALAEAEYARVFALDEPDAWDLAANRLETISHPWWTAYARYRQAQAELRSGRPRPVVQASLATAYRTAVGLRATRLQAAVEAEARAAGLSVLPVLAPAEVDVAIETPMEPRGLTPRERQVLHLLGTGNSNRTIAQSLGISEKTVSVHVGNITAKLGVANRLEAAAVAMRLALSGAARGSNRTSA